MPPQLTRVSVSSIPVDQRTCSICQDTIGGREGGEPVKTECNHFFDRNCIQQWLDGDKSTCPVCRKEIRNTGGGGLRDRIRDVGRIARLARERAMDEREQMQQAQADYGGAHDYPGSNSNHSDSNDDPPLWVEYEPRPLSSPGNFNTPPPPRRPRRNEAPPARNHPPPPARNYPPPARNHPPPPRRNHPPPPRRSYSIPPQRNHSPPRPRYQEPRDSTNTERLLSEYSSTLEYIESLDHNIIAQAQLSYHANERHHAAEREVQAAFTQLQVAAESGDSHAMEYALALQDPAVDSANEAYVVLQSEGLPLMELIGQREQADERLTRMRREFEGTRNRFMNTVREMLQRSHGESGGGRERARSGGVMGRRHEEYRGEVDEEDGWESYDPVAWHGGY